MNRYAAIDIGSNAVRLLIADVNLQSQKPTYKKNTLIRVPLRLGDDAFINRQISPKKEEELFKTMLAFKSLMEVYHVEKYLACATSAMRESVNGPAIVSRVKTEIGLAIEIVGGEREANLIYANHIEESLDENKSYLYIDVGGGSTELSVFVNQKMIASQSFNLGTIRILDNQDEPSTWAAMQDWIKANTKHLKHLAGIGTGGNINKLFKMSGEKDTKPMRLTKLKQLANQLNDLSLKERMEKLKLNPDRADVIIPACEIYLSVMKWAKIKEIYVPRVGLADGIIQYLIAENTSLK